ncbi:RHS repeat-associated core domain-containing protein [Kosakonia sp. LAM2021]|uniref:RHS repeat-associated core domain-containing protein n=1 Tax=Kosakonia sp. LAM2021 TaxID=2800475 RepID=UPI001F2ED296|nr:RHS repeat-associated core domain-containing protein [Kosakonia sp. LAM2021]
MSTSLYSKTPHVAVLDNRALAVRDIVYHRHPDTPDITDERITCHQFDARGLPSQSADPRLYAAGLANFSYLHGLNGTALRTQSADAGTSVALNDASGRAFLQVSNIGVANDRSAAVTRTFQYEDANLPGRLLSITEQVAGDSAHVTERFVRGGASADEQSHNLAGQPVSHYDPAGLLSTNSVSLSGVPLSVTRQLLPDDAEADWQGADTSAWNDLLAGETYTMLSTVDAAGNVLTTTDAKGNIQRVAFNVAGLLKGSWLTVNGGSEQVIVKSLTYSAAGQKLREEHGNGVVTTYSYEAETQRLVGIKTERITATKVLQDLRYEYDPVGNVLVITNDAEETRFWRNQQVVPENTYAYDSLYQLVSATGREMASAVQQNSNLPDFISFDSATYTNYSRIYTYDNAGNLTKIQHSAPASGNNYTTSVTVSDRSNRAVLSTLTENPADVEALFTAGGQQKQLLPGQSLLWTARQELQKVTPVTRDGAADDSERYRYDASSQRVLKITTQLTGNSTQTKKVIYLPGLELRSSAAEELQVITVGVAGRAQVRVLHWESGQPAGISNNQVRYSYDNLTGSSALEVDASGELISQEEYYPYGGTALFAARSQLEADYKILRYSGKEQDTTGLYYYGYRYYQPWAGRWLSVDPAGRMDGLNLFRMVRNNPITLHDTNGLVPVAKSLTAHVQRAGLQAEPVESYQDVFHAIFHVHGEAAYNEVWATLSESIPLSSSEPITREHMEAIADFIEKKEIISGMVYASTTPSDIPIDISEVQAHLHKIPLNILKKAHSLGQFITATNDNITNHPGRHHFKGVTPRGWPDDLTWDSVPGVGAEGQGAAEGMHPDEQ